MKFVILAALAAVAAAFPADLDSIEQIPILRDERVQEEDGRYSLDIETGNGIVQSQAGSPDGPDGAIVKAGSYKYVAPDGTDVEVTFVADGNGFQPQSDLLPQAPEFPFEIPQFVLDQIAKAAEETKLRAEGKLGEDEYL